MPLSQLLPHGGPTERPAGYFATLNQLAHGDKCDGEPGVQAYLWGPRGTHNAAVPVSMTLSRSFDGQKGTGSCSGGKLTASKHMQWAQHAANDAYATTARTAAEAVATLAATQAAATGVWRPAAAPPPSSGLCQGQVGRKPVGPFVEELDRNHHTLQLRGSAPGVARSAVCP